ncbi:MAG: glycosyltransferase [Crocinitomicaceae bacterium]|nr:glycosyltransferase [Crocinitomicaceae bacterium]MBK8926142.1 glycosyltransferase [Crocinitomicaceae bacterium]
MVKRIGILVLGDERWAGGLYYPIHVLQTLQLLTHTDRPKVYVFYGNDSAKLNILKLNLPDVEVIAYNQTPLISTFHKIIRKIFKIDFITSSLAKKYRLDYIYPYNYNAKVRGPVIPIAWFPDFQHKFLPQFFTQKEINHRDHYLATFSERVHHIVFSSQTALKHYMKFYPESKAEIYIFKFVSSVSNSLPDAESTKNKYQINKPFFMVANQFWKHKNHLIVIEALHLLNQKNRLSFDTVFSGKQDEPYFSEVKKLAVEFKLQNRVHFIGFIPREDQLCLMKESLAIVQPSLFEGWSTVIEDAKSLNKQVIASDIEIHQEQLENMGLFFKPNVSAELAELLGRLAETGDASRIFYESFHNRAVESAQSLLKIFKE